MPSQLFEFRLSDQDREWFRGMTREEIRKARESEQADQLVTLKEAAAMKKVIPKTIRNWCKKGNLKGELKGGRLVFKLADINHVAKYKHQ